MDGACAEWTRSMCKKAVKLSWMLACSALWDGLDPTEEVWQAMGSGTAQQVERRKQVRYAFEACHFPTFSAVILTTYSPMS